MISLDTSYAGLTLKNPIIISSSGLTDSVAKIQRLQESGAGAVVLKSLFEEQMGMDAAKVINQTSYAYPETGDYVSNYLKNNSIDMQLDLIRKAKLTIQIPVIASVNCQQDGEWINYALEMERAGADAIELNIYFLPIDADMRGSDLEKRYLHIVEKVMDKISIPITIKLANQFSNPVFMVNELYKRGVKAVVLFNRFYEPDIDIDNMQFKAAPVFSGHREMFQVLRWTGIISSQIETIDVSASTGVHDAKSVIKMLLAGASGVQICSAVYSQGPGIIPLMLDGLRDWMGRNHYNQIKDFQGKMSYRNIPNPDAYERAQFMRYYSASSY